MKQVNINDRWYEMAVLLGIICAGGRPSKGAGRATLERRRANAPRERD